MGPINVGFEAWSGRVVKRGIKENSIFVSFLLSRFKKHTKPSDTQARPQHTKLTKNYDGLDSCYQINQFCTSVAVIAQGPVV